MFKGKKTIILNKDPEYKFEISPMFVVDLESSTISESTSYSPVIRAQERIRIIKEYVEKINSNGTKTGIKTDAMFEPLFATLYGLTRLQELYYELINYSLGIEEEKKSSDSAEDTVSGSPPETH